MIEAWVMFTHRRGRVREMVESLEAERRQQTEGSLCLWGKERLRDIDVKMEERDEERQLRMERKLLALKRERVDEAKTEMIKKN